MADEANKEFTIQVQFSGVEQEILGNFKKQIDSVANAIKLINDTMKDQIKALESIQKDIRSYNSGGGPGGGGGTGGGGGGIAQNLAGKPHGDGSEMVRSMQELTRALGSVSGGAQSLFGARGLTSGWREWDQENSFEKQQFPGAGFTPQDAIRQMASLGGINTYRNRGTGEALTPAQVQALHLAREQNPNQNVWRAEDYIKDATEGYSSWWQKPFQAQLGHITGMTNYMGSLGNTPDEGVVRSPWADRLQTAQHIYPYFAKGGVFNPGTYGLGINNIKGYAANLGQMSRFGMQFGNEGSINPFDSRNAEAYGSQFQAKLQSWGGFNPMLSGAQAQEIIGHVAGMGYSGGTGEQMRNLMSDVTQHTNIGMGDQAAIIDKSFRWGYANLQQLAAFMKNDIPQAAQAARMNVGQFAAQMQQVSGNVANARGMNAYDAMGAISDMSTGTGMDPGTAAGLLSNAGMTFMAASEHARATGGKFSISALDRGDPAADQLRVAAQRFKLMTGGIDANEIAQLQRDAPHDPRARARLDQAIDRMKMAHLTGAAQQYLPGIDNVNQVKNYLSDQGIRQTSEATKTRSFGEHFEEAYKAGHDAYIQHHGSDGGHSFWNSSLLNLGDKSPAEKAGEKHAAEWADKQGSRKDMIRHIQEFAKQSGWSDDALGRIIGHTTVSSGMRGVSHEILGGHYSQAKLAENLHKEIARQTKKDEDKKSKNLNITLTAGPALAGLFRASSGSGAVAGGTNIPGVADPTSQLWSGAVDSGG